MTVFLGRGRSEKVTLVSSFATIEGPTPLTRSRPSLEPKGPKESRSATIRRARAGPMCLKDSISSAVATSRSTGPGRGGTAFFLARRLGVRPAFLAESAAFIWDSRAARAASPTGPEDALARNAFVAVPNKRTAEKKRRAFRSAGVPMVRQSLANAD